MKIIWSVLAGTCWAQLRIIAPPSLKQAYEQLDAGSEIIPVATATFGSPVYGSTLVGRVVLVNSTGCEPDYHEPAAQAEDSSLLKKFFLIPRGGCSFARKAAVAESLKADAAIFMDFANSTWTRNEIQRAVLSSSDTAQNPSKIPSVLLSAPDAKPLAAACRQSNTEPPLVALEWDIPQRKLVIVDLWYLPTDVDLLVSLYPVIEPLKTLVHFKTHIYITSNTESCYNGNKKLCLPAGYDPAVLREAARQLCIRKITAKPFELTVNDKPLPDEAEDADEPVLVDDQQATEQKVLLQHSPQYWGYLKVFKTLRCSPTNDACANEALKALHIDHAQVDQCIRDEGELLLMAQREITAWGASATRINGARFAGTPSANAILKASCTALEPDLEAKCYSLVENITDSFANDNVPPTPAGGHDSSEVLTVGDVMLLSGVSFSLAILGAVLYNAWMRANIKREMSLEMRQQIERYYQVDDVWNHPETEFTQFAR